MWCWRYVPVQFSRFIGRNFAHFDVFSKIFCVWLIAFWQLPMHIALLQGLWSLFPTILSRYLPCNKNIYFLSNHCKDKPFMSTIPIITICFFLFEFVTNNETMLWKMHCIGLVWFLEGVAIFSSSWIWPAVRAITPSKMEVAPHPQNNWYQTSHKTF